LVESHVDPDISIIHPFAKRETIEKLEPAAGYITAR
jgi:hypothetical protein